MYMVYKHVCVSVLLGHVRTLNALFYDSLPYSSRTRYLTESGARLAATNWAIFLIPSFQFSMLQAHMVTCGLLFWFWCPSSGPHAHPASTLTLTKPSLHPQYILLEMHKPQDPATPYLKEAPLHAHPVCYIRAGCCSFVSNQKTMEMTQLFNGCEELNKIKLDWSSKLLIFQNQAVNFGKAR